MAEQPERYFTQCRIPVHDEMKNLLICCLNREVTDTSSLRAELENMPINPHYDSSAGQENIVSKDKKTYPRKKV